GCQSRGLRRWGNSNTAQTSRRASTPVKEPASNRSQAAATLVFSEGRNPIATTRVANPIGGCSSPLADWAAKAAHCFHFASKSFIRQLRLETLGQLAEFVAGPKSLHLDGRFAPAG